MAVENQAVEAEEAHDNDVGNLLSESYQQNLAEIFTEATQGHSPLPDDENPEKIEEKAQAAAKTEPEVEQVDPRFEALAKEIRELRDGRIADQTRINILQHQLGERQNNQPQQPPEEEEISREKFKELAAKDPTSAIYDLFEQTKKIAKNASTSAVTQAKGESVALMERQKSYDADRATVISEFGELLDSNKEFANLASQIYDRSVSQSPEVAQGIKWHPGAMYAAMSMAYTQLHKAGRLQTNDPKVVQLRAKKPAPAAQIRGSEADSSVAKSIADKIPPTELAVMKRTANSMGMPLSKYLSVFEDLKKRDPSYGGNF